MTLNQIRDWYARRQIHAQLGMAGVVAGVGLLFLLVTHRTHLAPYLPLLIVLACPLMHLFMHHGHHHGDRTQKGRQRDRQEDADGPERT